MSKSPKILTGNELFTALSRLTATVKWVRPGSTTVRIQPNAALAIARGGIYEGSVEAGRLRLIRELVPPKPVTWQPCWRTTEAAVFPPGVEWVARTRSKGRPA